MMTLKFENILIRLATSADADYLYPFWNASGWDITLSDAQKMLADGNSQHMIELDGKVIGDIHFGEIDKQTAEVGIFIRDESAKGHGYGKIVTKIYIDALVKKYDYEIIMLNTGVNNQAMRAIAENTFGITPVLHENVYQADTKTYDSYIEYRFEVKNWQNDIEYDLF